MKKFMNKKCTDMTVGESIKFGIIVAGIFTGIYVAIAWMIYKYEAIVNTVCDAKNYIKSKFMKKKQWVDEEDEGR